jgi:acetyl-CoA acetyltransferase
MIGKSRGAVVGIGELKPVRMTEGRATLDMIAEVSRLAVLDAGLEPGMIDGLLVGPQVGETPQHVPATVAEYLGIAPTMANIVDLGGASGPGMVWRAAAAIDAGMCEAVLCVLANTRELQAPRSLHRNPIREFGVPFGASGTNISYALKQAHMARYRSRDDDFAAIPASARANTQLNPMAIFYGKPASEADVLASPMVASPLRLYEIVMPVAGGEALVVVSDARAKQLSRPPVHLLGAGEKVTHRAVSQAQSLTSDPLKPSMEPARSGVKASDLNLLSLCNCYTIMVAATIEDAGLCKPGEIGSFIRAHGLGHDSDYPLNTHGGQIGFGQPDLAGGMTHVIEAVRQLRGEAEGRQIRNARLALMTGTGATMSEATALVLGAT